MNVIITLVKNWTLPLAIIVGAIGFPLWRHFGALVPYLIFTMLLLTFCKMPFSSLRFRPLHWLQVVLQIGGAIAVYFILKPVSTLLAEAAMVCMITPTGTAAAVITQKLGGNPGSLTSYMVLSNLATAIAAPLFFPIIHPMENGIGFMEAFFIISQKVFPVLVLPLLAAWFLKRYVPAIQSKLARWQEAAFYLWGVTLMIVIGKTVYTLVNEPSDPAMTLWLGGIAVVVCCVMFTFGKWLGVFFGERITSGQALGQKNAILAAWLAQTYLTPIVAVTASAYIVWQNLFNAWQLWMERRKTQP